MLTISKKKKKMFTARSWQDQLGKQQFNEDIFFVFWLKNCEDEDKVNLQRVNQVP